MHCCQIELLIHAVKSTSEFAVVVVGFSHKKRFYHTATLKFLAQFLSGRRFCCCFFYLLSLFLLCFARSFLLPCCLFVSTLSQHVRFWFVVAGFFKKFCFYHKNAHTKTKHTQREHTLCTQRELLVKHSTYNKYKPKIVLVAIIKCRYWFKMCCFWSLVFSAL